MIEKYSLSIVSMQNKENPFTPTQQLKLLLRCRQVDANQLLYIASPLICQMYNDLSHFNCVQILYQVPEPAITRRTVADNVWNTFMSCSSLGLPSGSGAVSGRAAGVAPRQYATASRSNSDKQVGSMSYK